MCTRGYRIRPNLKAAKDTEGDGVLMRVMRGGRCLFRRVLVAGFVVAVLAVMALCVVSARAQDSPAADAPPQPDKNVPAVQEPAQQAPQQAAQQAAPVQAAAQEAAGPVGGVPDVFEVRIPAEQMAFLSGMAGVQSGDVIRDKQFKRLMKQFVPTGEFHYGRDMGMDDALHMVMDSSRVPAQVQDGRYFTIAGSGGPYLAGRAMLWIDMKEGIGIGAFYFHPTNGEPTPSVAVFSRQVKEKALGMTDMPEAFADDESAWAQGSRVPALTTRYFITGSNMRVLLEHDEDYCSGGNLNLVPQGEACEQMDADAADLDEVAAYYLDQVHYRMNATAWMIGPDQVAWIGVRDRTCGGVADPLGCRIRVTREHVHVLTGRPGPGPHPVGRR
jgi:hypothetical protein